MKALKASTRTWRFIGELNSVNGKFLPSDRFVAANPGPRNVFPPELPNVYALGTAYAATLNHSTMVGWMPWGLPTRFGYQEPPWAPERFADPTTTVYGKPERRLIMPEARHPPRIAST